MIPDGYIAFTTARIGQRLVVYNLRPAAQYAAPMFPPTLPDDALEIALLPTDSMGSGSHPTTLMCLELLEQQVTAGCRVFDLGCGTGVLSIAAAKLGAGYVLAVDIELDAVETSKHNVGLNGVVPTVEVVLGSVERAEPGTFDGMVANLLAPTLIHLAPRGLASALSPGGWAIFSGVLGTQVESVRAALDANGLHVSEVVASGQWVALKATRDQEGT